MKITSEGAALIGQHMDGDYPEIRLLVTGGDGHGFRVELELNQTDWPGDQVGEMNGVKWRVDPVSWQFLVNTVLDQGSAPNELLLRDVPDIGPDRPTKDLSILLG